MGEPAQFYTRLAGQISAGAAIALEAHPDAARIVEQSETRYRTLLQNSPEAIYLCDAQSQRVLDANLAFLHLLGYTADDLTELYLADFLAYDRREINVYLEKVLERGEPHVRERLWRRRDGTILRVEVTSSVVYEAEHSIVLGVGRDVTERRRSEQEIRQRADEFQALYETSLDLAEFQDLSRVLSTILARAASLLRVPNGGLYLYDAIERELDLVFTMGRAAAIGSRLKLGEGLAGAVAQTRQPHRMASCLAREPRAEQAESFSFGATIGVPMLHRGELIGALTVSEPGESARDFSDADVRLLALFASQAASAVANARLFEQMSQGRERLRELSHQLLQTQELERRYLARELHDEVGQMLTVLNLSLQRIERATRNPKIRAQVNGGLETIQEILQHVRDLAHELRPAVLDNLGLGAALEWFLHSRLARTGLSGELISDLSEGRFSPDIELACFRIAQEALTNVMRHAQAKHVTIELHQRTAPEGANGSYLELLVRDDGIGFDLPTTPLGVTVGSGLGLLGMRERAVLAGGSVTLDSAPGKGTCVHAQFSLVDEEVTG